MGYFSWLADELTEIEERLAESDLAEISGPLRKAINKAFVKACEADREQRLVKAPVAAPAKVQTAKVAVRVAAEAEPSSYAGESRSFGWKPGGGATGGTIQIKAKTGGKPVTGPITDPIPASADQPRRPARTQSHAHPAGATAAPRR